MIAQNTSHYGWEIKQTERHMVCSKVIANGRKARTKRGFRSQQETKGRKWAVVRGMARWRRAGGRRQETVQLGKVSAYHRH